MCIQTLTPRGEERRIELQKGKKWCRRWEPNLGGQILVCSLCRVRADMKTGIHALYIQHSFSANVVKLDTVTIRSR